MKLELHLPALVLLAAPNAPLAAPPPPVDVGDTERVSVSTAGDEGDFYSYYSALSADGRYVVFDSRAATLVPGDTNGSHDVFVHDRQTGETTRVSVSSSGAQANGGSTDADISADGRLVTFWSNASNLVPNDFNGTSDVFVHDRDTGQTTLVSLAADGSQTFFPNTHPRISGDGRFVVFLGTDPALVPGSSFGFLIVRRELATGVNVLCSVDDLGVQADAGTEWPDISDDGRFVAFQSVAGNLVPGDTNGNEDVFVRDVVAGTTVLASVPAGGGLANWDSLLATISGDGTRVAFESRASNMVPGDTNGAPDVFVRDLVAGTTTLVSVDSAGVYGDWWSQRPWISSDGSRVAFYSWSSNLVPNDTNSFYDVFVRDLDAGTTTRVSVDSTGVQSDNHSYYPAISGDGTVVSFMSDATNLVPGDTNGFGDVFAHQYAPAGPPLVPTPARRLPFMSSESYVGIATCQPAGVARSTSASYVAQWHAGLTPSAGSPSSTSFAASLGTLAIPSSLASTVPLVFGAAPGYGEKGGGEAVGIHGFQLDDGSGTAAVELVAQPAVGVTTTSNTVLAATSAPGVNPFGNPLGRGSVQVTTLAGSGDREDAFVYGPALAADQPPQVGATWNLELHAQPGDLFQVGLGTSIPGVALPLPPLEGALEILTNLFVLTGLLPATGSVTTVPLPVPNNPALAGVALELQAGVLTGLAPLTGSFTNRLVTTVVP